MKAPSRIASRKLGHRQLCLDRASSVSRSCTEAGTTATASQVPSGITRTRACTRAPLSGIVPTWPAQRDALDRLRVDDAQARLGPAAHRRAAAAGHIAQQAVEQPLLQPFAKPTVYGAPGRPAWRRAPAMGRRRAGARRSRAQLPHRALPARWRGGSTRSSQRATSATAFNDTISFKRASWRARCASVHICPSVKPQGSLWDQIGIRHTAPLKQALSGSVIAQVPTGPHQG